MWKSVSRRADASKALLGLPIRTAILYGLMLSAAFGAYSAAWPQAPFSASDTGTYLAVASDLHDFRIDDLSDRTPGYPLLLLLTGSEDRPSRALFVVSLLLHFASIWFLACVLAAAGLTEAALLLFGAMLLLPPFVEPAAYALSENLTALLIVVGFGSVALWLLREHSRWLILSGLAIGAAALVRPTFQALAVPIGGSVLTASILIGRSGATRRLLPAMLVVFSLSTLLVGGYTFFNYFKFGYFGLSPIMPFALTTRTARVLERLPDEYRPVREVLIQARDADLVQRGGSHTGYGYVSNPGVRAELTRVTGLRDAQLSQYLLRLNLLLIRAAPLEYLYDVSRAFCFYWFPSATRVATFDSRPLQMAWAVMQFSLVGVVAVTATLLAGMSPYVFLYRRLTRRQTVAPSHGRAALEGQGYVYVAASAIVLYTASISSFVESGDPRYRAPIDGVFVVMAFLGTTLCLRMLQRGGEILRRAVGTCADGS
jgi:hypothetical protein